MLQGTCLFPTYMISTQNNQVDCVYWNDLNKLTDRLSLLLATQAARNQSHTSEIMSIITIISLSLQPSVLSLKFSN